MDEKHSKTAYAVYFVLFMVTLLSAATAKDLAGSWIASQPEMKMTFHENGTFILATDRENRAGNYELVKNKLVMVDTHGRSFSYTIHNMARGRLTLVDAKGQQIVCERTDVIRRKKKPNGVLAEMGEHRLLENHVDIGLLVMQFVSGHRLQPREKDDFTRASIHEFGKAPKKFLEQVAALKTSMQNVARQKNPLDVGASRQQLLSGFYTATRHLPERDQPLMVAIVNRYVKMLAYDEQESLMLTDQDVNALLDYMEFIDQLSSGSVRPLPTEKRRKFAESLVHNFAHLDTEQKRFLCAASVVWPVVDYNWQQFSRDQRRDIQSHYRNYQSGNKSSSISDAVPASMAGYIQLYRNMTALASSGHGEIMTSMLAHGGTGSYWKARGKN